jgi:hypothetical protein
VFGFNTPEVHGFATTPPAQGFEALTRNDKSCPHNEIKGLAPLDFQTSPPPDPRTYKRGYGWVAV